MEGPEENARLSAAITLMTAFGNPFGGPPPKRQRRNAAVAAELAAAGDAFWASPENVDAYRLEKDARIPLDPALEIRVPKHDAAIQCAGRILHPLWQTSLCEIGRELGARQGEDITWRKVGSLNAAQSGPGWYDRFLMTLRLLAATTPAQRMRLLNTQQRELYRDHVIPLGLALGRYEFTQKTVGDVRKALRKLRFLNTLATVVRAVARLFR